MRCGTVPDRAHRISRDSSVSVSLTQTAAEACALLRSDGSVSPAPAGPAASVAAVIGGPNITTPVHDTAFTAHK